MEKTEILKIFEQTEGILHGHFQLASGRHSDTYMQCAKLFMYADKAEQVCKALAEKLSDITIDTVAAPAVGGVIMGYEVSRQLKVPNIFFERVNGEMSLKRGFSVRQGERFLVTEDVVTTGGSVREVIALIEKLGGKVAAVASIVDRSGGKADFSGKPFIALLPVDVISYEAENCPLCEKGIPLTKPGTKASSEKLEGGKNNTRSDC